MSIRYSQQGNDELGYNPWTSDGNDDGWWAGVQKCAVGIALAATLAISASTTAQTQQQTVWAGSQDDPVGLPVNFIIDDEPWAHKLYNPSLKVYSASGDGNPHIIDEDIWRNPVSPAQAAYYVQLPFRDIDDAPVGTLIGQPEEDFWQNFVLPVNNPSIIPQQWTFDVQEPAGSLIKLVDEDYWTNPVAPVSSYPVPVVFADDITSLPFVGISPDEDYWQSRTLIPNHKVYGRGGGSGIGTIDDEVWQQILPAGPSYPVTLWVDASDVIQQPLFVDDDANQSLLSLAHPYALTIPNAFRDDEVWVPSSPTVPLPFDEEFWFNPIAPIGVYPVPLMFRDDDIFVPFMPVVTLQFDEETWQQGLSFAPSYPVTLWIDDSTATPIPAFIPDDDFWKNSVVPQIAQNAIPQYWNFDNQEPAGSLYGLDDELFWTNPTPPVQWTFGKLYLPDTNDDPAGSFQALPEEFYWQNPVSPVPASNYIKLPLVWDAEEIPANTLHGQADEDFWQNPVAPVAATLGRIYAPDQDDVPVGSLKGQPDEDYWINPVPPVASYPVPFVYTDREEIPAGNLYAHVDEDFWQNPVPPVPAIFGKLYAWDLDDVVSSSFHGQPDEDYWQNPVQPIPLYLAPRNAFSDDETLVFPPISFDEDFWLQGPAPIAATNYISFPILPDPEEIPAGSLIPPVPPPPVNPCPCSGIPNIPKDRVYDIVLCDQGVFVDHRRFWIACIFAQPGSLLAQHMGASIVTLDVYGTQAQAFAEARQFVNHNMGTM